jgi:hypothetical protein
VLAGLGAVLTTLMVAASAHAVTTVGQLPPEGSTPQACDPTGFEIFQTAVSSGSSYAVPSPGVITSWSTLANIQGADSDNGDRVAFRVYRPVEGFFSPIFESEAVTLQVPLLKTSQTRVAVQGGDLIGLRMVDVGVDGSSVCIFQTPGLTPDGDIIKLEPAARAIGEVGPYGEGNTRRVDVSAKLEPDADGDQFGDETQDRCPIQASTQGDCDLTVSIGKKPKKKTKRRKATIEFSGVGSVPLQCRLDKKDFAPCTSPVKLKKLKPRKHTFRIRALDQGGNPGPEAKARWRVTGG